MLVAYGPNGDACKQTKVEFWEELSLATENTIEKLYVTGNFNGRVGKRGQIYTEIIGKFGEGTRNKNG